MRWVFGCMIPQTKPSPAASSAPGKPKAAPVTKKDDGPASTSLEGPDLRLIGAFGVLFFPVCENFLFDKCVVFIHCSDGAYV